MNIRTGSCLCGAVAYRVEGEPLRVGLCHCADCRKSSGSAFTFFAVWPRLAFSHNGEIATFSGRSFCPACGSRLFCLRDDEAEIRLGSLDSPPTDLAPGYEVWIKRREPWMHSLPGADQYAEDAD
ncbi:GFA family protein [Rhizobium leguminosarum]|uniref:GFA family protein n=1 Tax=Rhizobium leguminosarum TaxID=384 RepID=UPI001C9388BF|nr:GFA family protein [Rhizobium leguminosarum]MBY5560713.1 GFA family protein [Rhizobium leguminosarum]MBY5714182.1 GFA family protein [Rhizobium leguminosarum]